MHGKERKNNRKLKSTVRMYAREKFLHSNSYKVLGRLFAKLLLCECLCMCKLHEKKVAPSSFRLVKGKQK